MLCGPKFGMLRKVLAAAVANLLADLDFRTPVTQSFPTTAAAFAALVGVPAATPSYIWDCQESSGNLVDEILSTALVVSGSPLYQRRVMSWDGTDYTSRRGVGEATGSAFTCADTAVMDSDSTSFAHILTFRVINPPASTDVLSKRQIAVAGYLARLASTGYFSFFFQGSSGSGYQAPLNFNHGDGALHYMAIVVDGTDVRTYSDLGSNTGTVSTYGSLTVATGLKLLTPDGMQITSLASFEGAAAEAIDRTALDAFWQHATDPTGLLTTISRNSTISVPLAAGYVGHFSGGTTPATTQLPIGYHAALSGTGLGLYCNSAVTNLIPYNRLSTGATGSTTNTDNAVDAPDGFRAAATHTATASPDYIGKTIVTVAATQYTSSVYLKESTVGVAGRVYAYDLTNGAEIAGSSQAYTADGTWEQRIEITYTTPALCVSVDVRVEITTSGETVQSDFWQTELGVGAGAIVNTAGGSAALFFADYEATAAAGVLCKAATGETEIVYVPVSVPSGNKYLCNISDGASFANTRASYTTGSTTMRMDLSDSAGGIAARLDHTIANDSEYTDVTRWDESGGLAAVGGGADVTSTQNGADLKTDVGTFTATENLTAIQVGNYRNPTTGFALDGFISHIRVWDAEGGA